MPSERLDLAFRPREVDVRLVELLTSAGRPNVESGLCRDGLALRSRHDGP